MRTPRHRLADSADTKEKCSLLFGFARDQFLLKRKGHFSLVFCPSSIRAGGGTNADSVLPKLFFGERIWQNTRLIFFEFGCRKWKRRGLGRNFPFAPLFVWGKFGAGRINQKPKPCPNFQPFSINQTSWKQDKH